MFLVIVFLLLERSSKQEGYYNKENLILLYLFLSEKVKKTFFLHIKISMFNISFNVFFYNLINWFYFLEFKQIFSRYYGTIKRKVDHLTLFWFYYILFAQIQFLRSFLQSKAQYCLLMYFWLQYSIWFSIKIAISIEKKGFTHTPQCIIEEKTYF